MTITLNSVHSQPNPGKGQNQPHPSSGTKHDLKALFNELLKETGEDNLTSSIWIDDETVDASKVSGMTLHRFTLLVTKLGKDVTYEKKTIIKITD